MANSNAQDSPSRALSIAPSTPVSSPTSARRQIKRAITEISPPGKANLHSIQNQPAHHPNDHRHRLHHRHHHHRKHVSQDVRRPHAERPRHLGRHSFDMARSSATQQGLGTSPMPSRRTSVLVQKDEGGLLNAHDRDENKKTKEERLKDAQTKANHRADGLKESLSGLHDFAADATKRLDETYYSVLEKMDALQSTIMALKDLAGTSHDIYGTFEKDSRNLEHDIVSQIGALGRFENQQSKIESLQSRIEGGRARIGVLSQRVEVVRERVEGWEEADREWQEKTRKKMKLIWSTTMVFILIAILLFVGVKSWVVDSTERHGSIRPDAGVQKGLGRLPNTSKPLSSLNFGKRPDTAALVDDDSNNSAEDNLAELQETLEGRRRRVDGERLRALDEL